MGTNPKDAYIRFDNELSAAEAIAWCNAQPYQYANAGHGFQRYCFKFINGKNCNNKQCENRHSWADTKDVLTGVEYHIGFNDDCPVSIGQPKNPQKLKNEISMQDRIIDELMREIDQLRTSNLSLQTDIVQLKLKIPHSNCKCYGL